MSWCNFNPRSHEGSDCSGLGAGKTGVYFNPRSHEGSDDGRHLKRNNYYISIHAPTRGATHHCALLVIAAGFQSTLPRGERLTASGIWASAWIFQSTLPRGERQMRYKISVSNQRFQSTLPRGERHLPNNIYLRIDNFNPRSHEGSDVLLACG